MVTKPSCPTRTLWLTCVRGIREEDDMLDKDIFEQYISMKQEIEDIRRDISATEDAIAKLVEEGTVKDRVYGGEGGIQGFNIEGFPVTEYYKRLKKLRNKRMKLIQKEDEMFDVLTEVEKTIDSIPNSRDRIMMRRIFLEGMTQEQVARQLHIDRSLVSKRISRLI